MKNKIKDLTNGRITAWRTIPIIEAMSSSVPIWLVVKAKPSITKNKIKKEKITY